MDRDTGLCVNAEPPWPALPSPYIVLIIIRIKCVLVQYITVVIGMLCTAFHIDLTLLNGKPCLICSGSFILILFWKGIVNTVWRRDERGEEGREWTNKGEDGGWILLSALFSSVSLPILLFFVSLFPLMSVLSVGSVNRWLSYTHTATLYFTYIAITSLILWPSVCLYLWLKRRLLVLWKALKVFIFTTWWQRKDLFEMISTQRFY